MGGSLVAMSRFHVSVQAQNNEGTTQVAMVYESLSCNKGASPVSMLCLQ